MLKLKILLLFSVAFGLTFAPTALADRYVVEPGTPGANPESPYDSWATAATNIQVAVGAASAGETIWVSNGTYKATGAGTLFAGVTTMVHLATNVILRSVNGPEVTILDGGYPDITNRVISLNRNAALYGFTVVNGRAGGGGGILIGDYGGIVSNCVVFSNISDKALNSGKYTGGGGIFSYATTGTGYFYNCSVYNNTTISNNGGGAYFSENLIASQCVFSNNATDGYGGGVYLLQGATALDDCIIINNSSTNSGAGLFAASGGAGAIISKCVISGNTGDRGAGCFLNSPVEYCKIIKCNISNNQAARWAGGIESQSSKVILTDCLVANNSAQEYAGGIHYNDSKGNNVAEIINCVIRDNKVNGTSGGAGAYLRVGSCRMVGCLVVSNVITSTNSGGTGAGINIQSAGAICENNTVVGNIVSNGSGGGIYMSGAGQVINTVIYGNTALTRPEWYSTGAGSFSNCCTVNTNGMNGSGNIAADPKFVNAAVGNYHLLASSPCVNAGINQDWMIAGVDLDGRPRLDRFTKQVDIGCYERLANGVLFMMK